MRVHRLLPLSLANGPGPRFAVWVQGCTRRCSGCFNPDTHDCKGGYEISVPEIIAQIPRGQVSGITVSGGEPFEQPEELAALLDEAGKMGLHRLAYSGNTYSELSSHKNRVVRQCLQMLDMLIDGPYEEGTPSDKPLAGSGNQRVLQLSRGEIVKEYGKDEMESALWQIGGEIVIDQTGCITATGIIDSRIFTAHNI